MSEIYTRSKYVQNKLKEITKEYDWSLIEEVVNDNNFFRALYQLINYSEFGIKSMPKISEILNPFKYCRQEDLKIVLIDSLSDSYFDNKNGVPLVSTKSRKNKKGVSFLNSINHFRYKRKGSMDYTYIRAQKQGVLILRLPFTKRRDLRYENENKEVWGYIPEIIIRKINEMDRNVVFVFFSDELNYLKKKINKNSLVLDYKYRRDTGNLRELRVYRSKNNKIIKKIDDHIKKHYNTEIEW